MEDFDVSGLIKEYLDDARGHLDRLDSALLELEKEAGRGVDVELVSELLGALHTLKGNSGMMGFTGIQQFVHKLEGLFKMLLEGSCMVDDALMERFFDAAGTLRGALEQIEQDPKAHPDLAAETAALAGPGPQPQATNGGEEAPGVKAARSKADSFRYIGEKTNILKVDFERLDHLLNLAGELVIHRTKLTQVDARLSESGQDREIASELSEATALIHKSISDLQEAIMKVRMLPIRHVLQRFPRMVRDLAKDKGKEINLTFRGEDTELDKTVIDEIGEPLIHLIRNAVDHGIETPQERAGKDKSPVGEITITAAQEGNNIIITVSDNGSGIDVERIKEKAEAIYPPEVLDSMGRENLLELIFEAGFSTARQVTEVSGRGVGLDVVKKNISRLGGIVEVTSEKDAGTTFTIKLPLTLAIISALMVRAGMELFALPLSSVIESLKLEQGAIHLINGREVIMLRDRVLPLIRLSDAFGSGAPSGRQYIVVVGRAEKKIGLIVDGLMGRQEVVIKALDDYVGESKGIAGATILGDGRVVLILDVAGLIDSEYAGNSMKEVC